MVKRLILIIIILSNSLMLNPGALLTFASKKIILYDNSRKMGKEGFISPVIFIRRVNSRGGRGVRTPKDMHLGGPNSKGPPQ